MIERGVLKRNDGKITVSSGGDGVNLGYWYFGIKREFN